MSQENLEIVKAKIDAYNREDWDAFYGEDVASGFEMDYSRADGPWRGVFGPDQARRVNREIRETWESARLEPHEFIEAGDLVVVPMTQHVKGRGGIEVAARGVYVWTIRTEQSSGWSCTRTRRTPSKTWGCRRKTLTPSPELRSAGLCSARKATLGRQRP